MITPKLKRILGIALIELQRGNPHLAVETLGRAMENTEQTDFYERRRILQAKDEADIGNPETAETLIGLLLSKGKPVTPFKPNKRTDGRCSPSNRTRAKRADKAMAAHRGKEEKDESDLCDLLANLMHMAHRDGVDFQMELNRATKNFNSER